MSRQKPIQYRHYEVPSDSYVLALPAIEWLRPERRDDAPHFHNLIEIGICREGRGELLYGSGTLPYSANTITVMPPHFPHSTYVDVSLRSRWEYILFNTYDFLRACYPEDSELPWRMAARAIHEPLHLPEGKNPVISQLLDGVLEMSAKNGPLYRERQKGLLLALVAEIARIQKNPIEEKAEFTHSARILHHALEYIGDNYTQPISVAHLASVCHMSESHFRRIFAGSMKMSPVTYINHVRITAACRMLRASGDTISSIALKSGFATQSTFNRTFQALIGISPRQWRAEAARLPLETYIWQETEEGG